MFNINVYVIFVIILIIISGLFDEAFHKVSLLNECYSYCISTIELVISGHDTYPGLIQEEGMSNDVESYQEELNCCKENTQLLAKFENVVKLFADLEPAIKSQYVQQLEQEVRAVSSLNLLIFKMCSVKIS